MRHARDVHRVGGWGIVHVKFFLVTPKVRNTKSVFAAECPASSGGEHPPDSFMVSVESNTVLPLVGCGIRS